VDVNLRFPWVLLIWPVAFTAYLTDVVVLPALTQPHESSATNHPSVVGSVLFFSMLVVLPVTGIIGYARSSVRSDGDVLVVRNGFVTRRIPAEDIDGFVLVNNVGVRRDQSFLLRPAITLRRGSPSWAADRAGSRTGWIARALRRFSNRRGTDLPIVCVQPSFISTRRAKRALEQLNAWHRQAVA